MDDGSGGALSPVRGDLVGIIGLVDRESLLLHGETAKNFRSIRGTYQGNDKNLAEIAGVLHEVLGKLLRNMAGDWNAGAVNFRAVTAYFRAVEEGNVANLDTYRQAIDDAADDVMDGTGVRVHTYRTEDWWKEMGGK